MDTSTKTILYVTYRDKKLGSESTIKFEIKELDDIKPIIKELRHKRLKILSYGVEISVRTGKED